LLEFSSDRNDFEAHSPSYKKHLLT